jgi:hypothetical protein
MDHQDMDMRDLLIVLAYFAGLVWIALRAYMRPDGIYLKSLIGFCSATGLAAGAWIAAGPFISNAAGFGALVIFLVTVAAAAVVAMVACTSATVRYLRDALAR